MSLHGYKLHKNEQNKVTKTSMPLKSLNITSTCSPVQNINYLNNSNIVNFFKYYQCIFTIFSAILINSLEIDQYDQIPTYQKSWSNIIEEIHNVIVSARNAINDSPIFAMNNIETMINQLALQLNGYPEYNLGGNAIKDILVKLSADIQIVKNEINYELDKVHSSNSRLTASPIYIRL